MVLTLIIAFLSLIALMVIHEFGHFVLAKLFGVRVDEFGIGYPPRIYGKKFGRTIYSLNWIPFGAFVRIFGESENINDKESFSAKKFWQKALIVLGGAASFWVVSILLLTIVMGMGVPTIIEDTETANLASVKVQIEQVAKNSPAEQVGLKIGDTLLNFSKAGDFQNFVAQNKGKEISLKIERGSQEMDFTVIPRENPPAGEGSLGVAVVRTALKVYPWYLAPIEGVKATYNLTVMVLRGWGDAIFKFAKHEPTGVQLMGPVGIFTLFAQASSMGVSYFLQFVAIISILIAFFNILPIPVTDGGKFLFLLIERIRRKPMNPKIEQNINMVFTILLLILMVWVTVGDVARIL